MTRETYMTKRDKDFMKLRDKVRKIFLKKKDWSDFKRYMNSYYV